MRERDDRDLVIDALAQSEAEQLERLVSLEQDVQAYRELARLALTGLHDLAVERDRLRAQLAQLRDEYRALRVQILRQAAA
jgi:hypothetical protein